jgi:hypothetical protein
MITTPLVAGTYNFAAFLGYNAFVDLLVLDPTYVVIPESSSVFLLFLATSGLLIKRNRLS